MRHNSIQVHGNYGDSDDPDEEYGESEDESYYSDNAQEMDR